MKKLFVFIIVLMFLASSSMTVLAAKPADKYQGKCWTKKVNGSCPLRPKPPVETCPDGWGYIESYGYCFPIN